MQRITLALGICSGQAPCWQTVLSLVLITANNAEYLSLFNSLRGCLRYVYSRKATDYGISCGLTRGQLQGSDLRQRAIDVLTHARAQIDKQESVPDAVPAPVQVQ